MASDMASESLGEFQREYSASAQGQYEVVTGTTILLAIIGIGAFVFTHSKSSSPALGVALLVTLAVGLGAYIYGGIRKLGRRVQLHTEGMILQDGCPPTAIRWDEVASLAGMLPVSVRGSPVYIGGPMQIVLHDGRRFRVGSGYAGLDALVATVHDWVLANLLPSARAGLERGETLSLGPLQVDRAGLHVGDRSLPWSEYQGVAFNPNDLMITRAGSGTPWATLKIAQLPNANLFLHLARGPRPV